MIRLKPIEAVFRLERETKNTYRYEEETDGMPPAVRTLYLQKWAIGRNPPQKIKVTISPA